MASIRYRLLFDHLFVLTIRGVLGAVADHGYIFFFLKQTVQKATNVVPISSSWFCLLFCSFSAAAVFIRHGHIDDHINKCE
jgi:hypothetical protein